jgi:hypothetical protein
MAEAWKKCTECRTDIAFGATYYQCSVSTCNRTRMPLVFCSVICWDSHLSSVRHRDAGAIEAKAPSKAQWEREQAESAVPEPARVRADETRPNVAPPPPPPAPPAAGEPRRVVVGAPPPASSSGGPALSDVVDKDVLIVVSKLKKYIKDRSGFNTSDSIVDVLSDHVRAICDEAIRAAARDERKTVLERDVPRPPRR